MTITKKTAFQERGYWIEGREDFDGEREIEFYAKVYPIGSEFGIDGGRISKLEIRLGYDKILNYDRGWDIEPTEEVKPLYEAIIREYN